MCYASEIMSPMNKGDIILTEKLRKRVFVRNPGPRA